jgi:hypothetical protein
MGTANRRFGFHVALMGDAGLIYLVDARQMGKAQPFAAPLYISWEGYEFLAAARDEKVWRKSFSTVLSKAGAISFELLKALLTAELRKQIGLQ